MEKLTRVEIVDDNNARFLEGKLKGQTTKVELIEVPTEAVSIPGDKSGPNYKKLTEKCPEGADIYFASRSLEVITSDGVGLNSRCDYNVYYLKQSE